MTQLSFSPEGRLLSGINHSYRLATSATTPPPADYFAGAGYLEEPETIEHADYGDALAVIGTTELGVLLTFRCPLLQEPNEINPLWESIAEVAGGSLTQPRVKNWPKNAKVDAHSWKLLSSTWNPLKAAVKKHLEANEEGKTNFYIGGHNNGGTLATLTALRLQVQENIKANLVITFGAPKPGDAGFAEAYHAYFKSSHFRYENDGDLLPHLPADESTAELLAALPGSEHLGQALKGTDHAHVGGLRFIRPDGEIRTASSAPKATTRAKKTVERLAHVLEEDLLSTFMDPHRPACGFSYLAAVAPDDFCEPIIQDHARPDEEAEKEPDPQTDTSEDHQENWEKELMDNPGCFSLFGWMMGR